MVSPWLIGPEPNCTLIFRRNGAYTTSPLIGRFCGNVQPPPMIPSFSNSLHLKFVSDMSHAGRGFMITWDGTTTG